MGKEWAAPYLWRCAASRAITAPPVSVSQSELAFEGRGRAVPFSRPRPQRAKHTAFLLQRAVRAASAAPTPWPAESDYRRYLAWCAVRRWDWEAAEAAIAHRSEGTVHSERISTSSAKRSRATTAASCGLDPVPVDTSGRFFS
jgi:hypothetical protein